MDVLDLAEFIIVLALLTFCASVWALNDPTQPYNYMKAPEFVEIEIPEESTEWKLNGIMIDGVNKSAILNGKRIREGEMIGNARVLTINKTSIVLEEGDRHLVVRLLDTRVKKPSRYESKP